jgi:large subunit ribosomal protein L10
MPIAKKEATGKQDTVAEVTSLLQGSQAVILTEYRGLTVSQTGDLRKKLSEGGATYSVVKNTLFKRAATEASIPSSDALDAALNGPTAIAFAETDAVASSKAILEYIATNRGTPLKVKGAVVGGKFYDAKSVEDLSRTPPREVLISQMLGSFNAPITGFVTTLNGIIGNFVYTLQAVADKKQAEAGS